MPSFARQKKEGAIVAAAIGMGVNGLRPVAEVQFADYIYPACDQIFSELARLRYRTAGEFWAQVTIRTPCGGGIRGGLFFFHGPAATEIYTLSLHDALPISKTLDAKAVLTGMFATGTISDKLIAAYDKELFKKKTLQDLPDTPRFVINSTSVQSTNLFRF